MMGLEITQIDIIDSLPDATFVIDKSGSVIAWNLAMEEMTGIKKKDIIGKKNYFYSRLFYGTQRKMLIDQHFAFDVELESKYDFFEKKGKTLFAELYLPRIFGKENIYLWAASSPLFDKNGNIIGAIETIRDITDRKKMEMKLVHMATHDSLTNTPNRFSLEENLKWVIQRAHANIDGALLLLDIDNFKLINDTLGHKAGDQLLKTLVNLIQDNLQKSDIIFRFGGDEFAIILENITQQEALQVAEKIRKRVEEDELCLTIWQSCINITISIGIVIIDGQLNFQKLLNYADSALVKAKEGGKNRVYLIKPEENLTAQFDETNRIISLIKRGIRENQFILHFQPVSRLDNKSVTHYEVLIRMLDEQGNILYPGKFIPIAERYGFMPQIDRWVITNSLQMIKGNSEMGIFINLSGSSLGDENLLRDIEMLIRNSEIEPRRIGFEITETSVVKDLVQAKLWIERLKNLGCKFALDDFGIGFSSFYYLRMLPVDYLKLDGSFIKNIAEDATHAALIEAMNSVAHTLGKETIAEFVENEKIVKILKKIGVDFGQGFYLGRPVLYKG